MDNSIPVLPLVSVIIATYNGKGKLEKTIDSVLSQSYTNYEIIIIDDGSSDCSMTSTTLTHDDRIIIHRNKVNIGLTASLKMGVDIAKGKYIARIDVGDYWIKDKIEKQVHFLEENPEYVICGTQVSYINKGIKAGSSWFAQEDESIRKKILSRQGVFEHSSILFRAKTINYRPIFRYSQDLDLYVRISFFGKMKCLPDELVLSAINPDGISLNKKYLQRQYQNYAYKNYVLLNSGQKDIVVNQGIKIRDNFFDRLLSSKSMPYFKRYINYKTSGSCPILWLSALFLSLLIYPPFLLDYLRKFFLSRCYK